MYIHLPIILSASTHATIVYSLSWCDTTASVFGRMYGPLTPPLPSSFRIPLTNTHVPLPFARRKSLAGFLAAAATGALIAFGFWTILAPLGERPPSLPFSDPHTPSFFAKLGAVSLVTGFISAFSEAIGMLLLFTSRCDLSLI